MPAVATIDSSLERIILDSRTLSGTPVYLEDLEVNGDLISKDLGRRFSSLYKRAGVASPESLFVSNPFKKYIAISSGYGFTPSSKEVRLDNAALFQVVEGTDNNKYITIKHQTVSDMSRVSINGQVSNIRRRVDTDAVRVIALETIDNVPAWVLENQDKIILAKIVLVSTDSVLLDLTEETGYRTEISTLYKNPVFKSGDDIQGSLRFQDGVSALFEAKGVDYQTYIGVSHSTIDRLTGSGVALADQAYSDGDSFFYRKRNLLGSFNVLSHESTLAGGNPVLLVGDLLEISKSDVVADRIVSVNSKFFSLGEARFADRLVIFDGASEGLELDSYGGRSFATSYGVSVFDYDSATKSLSIGGDQFTDSPDITKLKAKNSISLSLESSGTPVEYALFDGATEKIKLFKELVASETSGKFFRQTHATLGDIEMGLINSTFVIQKTQNLAISLLSRGFSLFGNNSPNPEYGRLGFTTATSETSGIWGAGHSVLEIVNAAGPNLINVYLNAGSTGGVFSRKEFWAPSFVVGAVDANRGELWNIAPDVGALKLTGPTVGPNTTTSVYSFGKSLSISLQTTGSIVSAGAISVSSSAGGASISAAQTLDLLGSVLSKLRGPLVEIGDGATGAVKLLSPDITLGAPSSNAIVTIDGTLDLKYATAMKMHADATFLLRDSVNPSTTGPKVAQVLSSAGIYYSTFRIPVMTSPPGVMPLEGAMIFYQDGTALKLGMSFGGVWRSVALT